MNVNSPAKEISDKHLSYARLLSIKADSEEVKRLGYVEISDEQIATIEGWIIEMRNQIPLLNG